MKIYRGPSSKDFSADQHELVDRKDFKDVPPWSGSHRVEVNITKDGFERHAIANVVFEEQDILHLHNALTKRWAQRAEDADRLEQEVHSLRSALRAARAQCRLAGLADPAEIVATVTSILNEALSKTGE